MNLENISRFFTPDFFENLMGFIFAENFDSFYDRKLKEKRCYIGYDDVLWQMTEDDYGSSDVYPINYDYFLNMYNNVGCCTNFVDEKLFCIKYLMKELFEITSTSDDEDVMMNNFIHFAVKMISILEELEALYKTVRYPGRHVVEYGKKLLFELTHIETPTEFYYAVSKKQDDLLDFAEDYEPIKAFFEGEQKGIFDKALLYLSKYKDSKTYIVDENLEQIVDNIDTIVGKQSPYSDIPKLPKLLQEFADVYSNVLDIQLAPVLDSVYESQQRVFEMLKTKEYADTKQAAYIAMFNEIIDGAKCCTNVSILRGYADRAEALKIRLLNEIDQKDREIAIKKAEEIRKRLEAQAKENGQVYKEQIEEEIKKEI